MEIFLILYLAYLAADFLLQSDAMVKRKKHASAKAYLQHGAIHYAAIAMVVAAFHPALLARFRFQAIALALVAAHLLIDLCMERVTAANAFRGVAGGSNVFVYLADQVLHFLTIAAAALWIAGTRPGALAGKLAAYQAYREKILVVLVVYFGVVFAAGHLIRFLTKPLTRHLPSTGEETTQRLRNAGMYIGWLERSIVLTALLLRSPATVGLVLAAKSIARFPELGKSELFAEYFLIGTLLSLLAAIFGGILLLKLLTGTIQIAQ
jgi:hypothetical protein